MCLAVAEEYERHWKPDRYSIASRQLLNEQKGANDLVKRNVGVGDIMEKLVVLQSKLFVKQKGNYSLSSLIMLKKSQHGGWLSSASTWTSNGLPSHVAVH